MQDHSDEEDASNRFVHVLTLNIPHEPLGKPSVRVESMGSRTRMPKSYHGWVRSVKAQVRRFMLLNNLKDSGKGFSFPLVNPTQVCVSAYKKRPRNLHRKKDPNGPVWCAKKPDGDNILKSVMDALVKSGILLDDNIVVDQRCRTYYTGKGEDGCVKIFISCLEEMDE